MSHSRLPSLNGLLDIARRDQLDVRPTLLRVLTDLYVREAHHSPTEEKRYTDLAIRLFEAVDPATRAHVANTLAGSPLAPRGLLIKLAREEIEVAGPILRRSTVLTEDDLIEILITAGPRHAAAIGERTAIGPRLAQQLVHATRDRLAANLEALKAIGLQIPVVPSPPLVPDATPVASADTAEEDDDDLSAPLLRGTLPDVGGRRAGAIRIPVATVPPVEPPANAWQTAAAPPTPAPALATVEPATAAGFLDASREARLLLLASGSILPAPFPLSVDRDLAGRLERAALQRDGDDFAREIAAGLDLSPESAKRIVDDAGGEALVVVCRALDIPIDVIHRVLLFLNPAIGRSVERVHALAELAEVLDRGKACGLVAAWRGAAPRAAARTAAHRPLEMDDARPSIRRDVGAIAQRPPAPRRASGEAA